MKSRRQKKRQIPRTAAELGSGALAQSGLSVFLWVAAILVAAGGIFWLPWLLSPTVPASGDSYVLGFDNRVATIAFAVAILLGTAARLVSSRPQRGFQWLVAAPRLLPPWNEAAAEYAILIAVIVVKCGAVWFWSQYLVDISWCESRMFVYDIDLMKLGQVPYRDFMFIYGPGTLYLPYWLSCISGGAVSTEQAYSVFMIVFDAAGFIAVFLFVRSLELPKSIRWLVLLICLVTWMTTTMGLQYTVIRYFSVAAALILLHRTARGLDGSGVAASPLFGLTSALATTVCLSISPDIGVAGAAGIAAYGFALCLKRAIHQAVACWAGVILACAATMLAFPGYLQSIIDISSGTNNFPVLPAIYSLLMVSIVLTTIPSLIASALTHRDETRAPLTLALAIGGGMMLPAAFSRCDMGHVMINSTIPTLMIFPAAQAMGKIAFRVWMAVYVILFIVVSQVGYWQPTGYLNNFKIGISQHEFYKAHPEVVATWKAKWDALLASNPNGRKLHWSTVLPFPGELDQFTSRGTMVLTAGSEWNMNIARYLLLQRNPPFEYFQAYSLGAVTPAAIQTKVRQTSAYPFLLVPDFALAPLIGKIDMDAYRKAENASVSAATLFPINIALKNPPYFPDSEFIRQMLPRYESVARYQNYYILAKRDHVPNEPHK